MKKTKISNRFIVIGRTVPATEKIAYREPANQRATTIHRLVLIKNGELVGSKPGR